ITGQRMEGAADTINKADRTESACRDRAKVHQETWAALKRVGDRITRDVLTGKTQLPRRTAAVVQLNTTANQLGRAVGGSNFFRDVNSAALQHLDAWVPVLFGGAEVRSGQIGGYRVSSDALGRGLQEDLSITSKGIKDFGVHDLDDSKEGKRTPID